MLIKYPESALRKAKKIKLVLTDVDGVLTDGSINLFSTPEGKITEVKKFSAYDGISFHMLRDMGIKIGIITGGNAPATEHRAHVFGMDFLYYNFLSKLPALEDALMKTGLGAEQVAFIGDDLIDLPVLQRVGLACCPRNGQADVAQICHYVTQSPGGQCAFREVAELVLKSQDLWGEVMAKANVGEIGLSMKKKPLIVNAKTWQD